MKDGILKIKCQDCGETFDHYLMHFNTTTKKFCDKCLMIRNREIAKKWRLKNKKEKKVDKTNRKKNSN